MPPAKLTPSPKYQPTCNRPKCTLAADDFFHGMGVLAGLAMIGMKKSTTEGKTVHAQQTVCVHAESGVQVTVARQPPTLEKMLTGLPPPSSLACHDDQPKQTPGCTRTFRRKVSSTTTLRNMRVIKDMAEHLGLHPLSSEVVEVGPRQQLATTTIKDLTDVSGLHPDGKSQARSVSKDRYPVFRSTITLQDPAGRNWPVVYEAFMSNRQYHRRLSEGWRAFCRHHGVKVNHTIEFELCVLRDVLAVRVLRQEGGICPINLSLKAVEAGARHLK